MLKCSGHIHMEVWTYTNTHVGRSPSSFLPSFLLPCVVGLHPVSLGGGPRRVDAAKGGMVSTITVPQKQQRRPRQQQVIAGGGGGGEDGGEDGGRGGGEGGGG